MRGLAFVIEFLAQPVGDLGMDLRGADRLVVALVNPHREAQLTQIGFDRRSHVRILQFAGERCAVERDGAMHLSQRRCARRLALEALEPALPIRPEFARHAAAHERPAHRRRVGLQSQQLADIFLGQRLGDRREQLRDLHQRPLDAAQRRLQIGRMPLAIDRHAEIALGPEPCPKPRHRAANLHIAPGAAGKRVVACQPRNLE